MNSLTKIYRILKERSPRNLSPCFSTTNQPPQAFEESCALFVVHKSSSMNRILHRRPHSILIYLVVDLPRCELAKTVVVVTLRKKDMMNIEKAAQFAFHMKSRWNFSKQVKMMLKDVRIKCFSSSQSMHSA